jgi:glycosyltransferase involved in cell wall biosynthesis
MTARPDGRRLLVLTPFPPRLDAAHGGGQAAARLLLAHAERDRLVLLTLRGPGEEAVDPALASACEAVEEVERMPVGRSPAVGWRERGRAATLLRGWPLWAASVGSRELGERLARTARDWRPHVVQAEFAVMAPYLNVVERPARRVLVDHDPGVRAGGGPLARRTRRRLAAAAAAAADAVVVFTEEDRAAVRALAPARTLVERIPIPWDVPPEPLDPLGQEPPSVLFVGSFRHAPNVEAARRLVRLLPELRRRRSDVVLALVGEDAPPGLAVEGVVLPGFVPDVRPWLDAAAVVAAPLDAGGGMRVKVLDALASGKAVVGTPLAFEGLDVRSGEEVLTAADDAGLAEAMGSLLVDPERRRRLAAAARTWAAGLPTQDSVGAAYETLYRRLEEG